MIINNPARAERKLAQIGYYRLSGFWYPCRSFGAYDISTQKEKRGDLFQPNVNFNSITELYIFDKNLRQLMMDAIERVEIHVRTIIANELGAKNPLAYCDKSLVNPRFTSDFVNKKGKQKTDKWTTWLERHSRVIDQGRKQDSIKWHYSMGRAIPIWVAVETWDFGCISSYFEILKVTHQRNICDCLNIVPKEIHIFTEWLRHINTLRNRCAHHARIWNQTSSNPIPFLKNEFFNSFGWERRHESRYKIYGMICVLWFLVKNLGPSSQWINKVADLIDSKPPIDSCPLTSLGFPDNTGFPREKFQLPTNLLADDAIARLL